MKATESRTESRGADTAPAAKADDTKTEPKTTSKTEATVEDNPRKVVSDCVVKSDFHVGRAVNGKVCSYHAMHYKADGTPRDE